VFRILGFFFCVLYRIVPTAAREMACHMHDLMGKLQEHRDTLFLSQCLIHLALVVLVVLMVLASVVLLVLVGTQSLRTHSVRQRSGRHQPKAIET
jgi:hypothetical protein